MTVFITQFWRSTRLDPVVLLVCACLALSTPLPSRAQGVPAEVSQFRLERSPEGLFLTAKLRFDLPQPVEDALHKGIPMYFVAEADVLRERWYWTDKRILGAERHMRLAFQPLTRRWRVNVASGAITNNSLGLALNQSFESLSDALAAVQRLSGWKIADAGDIEADARYRVDLRFRLDVSQLPRPLQIGVLGQADWNVFAFASQRLQAEASQ